MRTDGATSKTRSVSGFALWVLSHSLCCMLSATPSCCPVGVLAEAMAKEALIGPTVPPGWTEFTPALPDWADFIGRKMETWKEVEVQLVEAWLQARPPLFFTRRTDGSVVAEPLGDRLASRLSTVEKKKQQAAAKVAAASSAAASASVADAEDANEEVDEEEGDTSAADGAPAAKRARTVADADADGYA